MSLVGIDRSHWLFSDLWLPNGWATVVYVVLSGYGIGWIFSARHPPERHKALLHHRSAVILAVMLLSNSFFAITKLVQAGDLSPVFSWAWWIGFITLTTPWTISGVLLPTVLVLLCAPALIRCCGNWPLQTLAALLLAQIGVNLAGQFAVASGGAVNWAVRLFLREGLGGFPVLPFVLNGCIGCWLGMYRHQNEPLWLYGIALLLLLQLGVYVSTFAPPAVYWSVFRNTAGPAGKFAWLFLCAGLLAHSGYKPLVLPIALIGKFALTTFVMHRIFLQVLHASLNGLQLDALPAELRYATLWIGTLTLTWVLCGFLQRYYNRVASPRFAQNKVSGKDDYFTQ
ncbi:hypothetical protein os1_27810 [Comamonadaceae bacterium OS-1]|nr:hypothetical protein os1_27810 [Comamonadaceae bacterium OS-1]